MKTLVEKLREFKRGPAIILPKDAGLIIALTGINKDSKVVDAGTGSGFLAAYLANICKEVTTYENRKEFFEIADLNLSGFKNVKLKFRDIYKGIKEKNLDAITLDLKEPWKVFKYAEKSLKSNGFLVAFLPTINQLEILLKEIKKYKFRLVKVTELLEREWETEDRIRPKSQMIAHTGFLVFIRKL